MFFDFSQNFYGNYLFKLKFVPNIPVFKFLD